MLPDTLGFSDMTFAHAGYDVAQIKMTERWLGEVGRALDVHYAAGYPQKFHFLDKIPYLGAQPLLLPAVQEMIFRYCGEYARLDNHFGYATTADTAVNIHGGPYSERRSVYWSEGRVLQTSNLKLGVALDNHAGFAVLPGSHRPDGVHAWRRPCDVNLQDMTVVPLTAGAVILFTDALIHGTVPYAQPRRMLYYTFTPGHVAWAQYTEPLWKPHLPKHAQRFIRPPGLVTIQEEQTERRVLWTQPTAT